MSDDMGLLRADVEIESPLREGDRRLLRDVLVDTGAELTWALATVLEGLNLKVDLVGRRLVSAGPMLAAGAVSGYRTHRRSRQGHRAA
jgi:hypothetical protein